MSFIWILVAGFLYVEMAVLFLLVLPVVSARRWSRLFRSRFMQAISKQAMWYFCAVLCVLVLVLLDSIREMRKYSNVETHEHSHLDAEIQTSLRLFRAQRNFYISGFALFLSFVIRRLILLINEEASLLAGYQAAMKQAGSATTAAEKLMEKTRGKMNKASELSVDDMKQKLKQLEEKLSVKQQLIEDIKIGAQSVTEEYDRLLEDYNELKDDSELGEGSVAGKKVE